ncbi:hypothetical protein PENSPDRAFT_734817 [Peniophora sp. CONT]|nr:hypothetical protein PENSPDRAFT_734817 [Peniophora sp. CONT]
MAGTKRSSPGAEEAKDVEVELTEEQVNQLDEFTKELKRAELILERRAQEMLVPLYNKRRELFKNIDKFWYIALFRHQTLKFTAQHEADKTALSYLEDIWVIRDKIEPKVFSLEFTFKENPYFSDRVLTKEYKYQPSADAQPLDADGVGEHMLDFSWDTDVVVVPTKINWKDADKALTKLYPVVYDDEDPEAMQDPGSFFNFFEGNKDPMDVGPSIANDVFPDAIQYFTGTMEDSEWGSDGEDEEDDDDDAEEIDLEKPKAKKPKRA